MDAKITKTRLSRMLSYDWLKIIAIAIAVIGAWSLILTMTATRITTAQSFVVYNYMGNLSFERTKFYNDYSQILDKGVFSHEVLQAIYYDLPANADYSYTILDAHLAADEGDVVFVADIDDPNKAYTQDGETLYDSYVQSMVGSYAYRLENLDPTANDGYFAKMRKYLNTYYNGDYANGELNTAKVESDFRARVEKNKDKRYKKESQIQQGIKDDILRIQSYRNGLIEFFGYVEEGLITFEKTTVYDREENKAVYEDLVATINICPNEERMKNLVDYVAYETTYVDEAGATQYSKSAENMHVAFMRMDSTEPGFEYESLLYVNYVVRTYRTAE